MGGIWSCFQPTGLEGLFFVSCDMPLFRKEMAAILMERWGRGRTRCCGGPGTAVYSRMRLFRGHLSGGAGRHDPSGNYRLMKFLDSVRCIVVDTSEAHIPGYLVC